MYTEFKLFYNLSVNFSVGILCGCHSSGTACYCFPGRTHSPNNLLSPLPLRRFLSNARPAVTPFSYPAIRIYIWMDMKRDVLLRRNVVIDLLFFLLYFRRFSHSYISQVNKHLKSNCPSHCHHWSWLVSHNETKVKFTSNRQCW